MKLAGATAVEETYPFGIGQRTKQEIFRQGKLQEIEEQNESIERVIETSVIEGKYSYNNSFENIFYKCWKKFSFLDEISRRRKVKSLTEDTLTAAERSQKRWSSVEDKKKVISKLIL